MKPWLYLGIAIVSEVIGTSALRACRGFSRLVPSLVVVIGYALAFFFLSLTLKAIPVGTAYAVWSGVGTALIVVIAWLFFGQSLDLPAVIGIFLIIAGVIILNIFSKAAPH